MDIPILDKRKNYGSMVGLLVDQKGMRGTLVQNNENPYIPSQTKGCIVYLKVENEDLDVVLGRLETAGGQLLLPITPIDPSDHNKGSVAWIIDSEGNRIGLHN